jgi:hypothetical protein
MSAPAEASTRTASNRCSLPHTYFNSPENRPGGRVVSQRLGEGQLPLVLQGRLCYSCFQEEVSHDIMRSTGKSGRSEESRVRFSRARRTSDSRPAA